MTYKKIKSCEYTFPNTNVPEEAKDFIKNILVLDPKMRMTTKEMLAHPFINNEDLIKSLPVEALIQIPTFKNEKAEEDNASQLTRVRSAERLRPEDFAKRKPELALNLNQINNAPDAIYEGMYSPRNAFND